MAEVIEPIEEEEEELEEPLAVVEPPEALPITPVERTKTSNVDDDLKVHLTPTQKTDLTDAGATTLHTHATDITEDTAPVLGGDLGLGGNNIDFPSVANISDVKDEDDMATDSATMLATQQSIKAYVDANSPNQPITLPFGTKTGQFTYGADTPIQTITYNPTTKTIVAMAARQGEHGEAFICRYGTNGVEGNFTLLDAFEIDLGAYYTFYGSVQLGSYIYTSIDIGGGAPEEIIKRTDLDGANGVNMNNAAGGDDDLNIEGMLVTDGTYLYMRISTTEYKQLTISGTDVTIGTTKTMGNGLQIDNGFGCDGTDVFGFDDGDDTIYGFDVSDDGTVIYSQAISYAQEIDGILYINGKFYTATAGYGAEGSSYEHPISIHLSRIDIAAY